MNMAHGFRLLGGICILAILSAVCSLSCGSASEDSSWQTGASGMFYTQDIARAQKEMSFRIVVPDYLPNNLSNPPHITGPLKGTIQGSDGDPLQSALALVYGAGKNDTEGLIEIYEWGYPVGHANQLDMEYETIQICRTEVVQTEYTESLLTSGGVVDHPGYLFFWNQNGVYVHAGIYHYEHDEAVKVVESMIQQGE